MKLTKNELRELKIYNPHELAKAGGNKIYIDYVAGESGRMARYPFWAVVGVGFKVNPEGHWHDYGNKTFSISSRADKVMRLNEAIDWSLQNFNIPKDAWEKDPFGGYQIKRTIQKAILKSDVDNAGN